MASIQLTGASPMRRSKLEVTTAISRHRYLLTLLAIFLLYLFAIFFYEFPFMSRHTTTVSGSVSLPLNSKQDTVQISAPVRPSKPSHRILTNSDSSSPSFILSSLVYNKPFMTINSSDLDESVAHAWDLGRQVFAELQSAPTPSSSTVSESIRNQSCPNSVTITGDELRNQDGLMVIPCGLTLGSHITVIGKPRVAHPEYSSRIVEVKKGEQVMVSQFMMELQGINAVDSEAAPKILHFNPRLEGDWSGWPVIEMNTCYRMQWGHGLRCDGRRSRKEEESVDGLVKCEHWSRDDDWNVDDSKTKLWLNRLMGNSKKGVIDAIFPFVEGNMFVLTLSTGLEGYHVSVDGRHVASFPYHPGFVLEDATGLVLNGDIEVQSVVVASLPASHPSSAAQMSLQFVPQLKAPSLPKGPVELFIGVLSAANHFAERMAVRKSWMSSVRRSSNAVVARFFVALHGRKEVNEEMKREAEFFGDIVVVPYMDNYDLVVLKTVAIVEFGVHKVSARYIMKCDDDTFVRVDSMLKELKKTPRNMSFYVGNINFHHKPLRAGKWAVTFEEWPEEDYPPYANGPGYIVSSDIARFVVSEFESRKLRLFKMEDVSMGMWVEQFNKTIPVEYLHSLKFCQFGCIEGYFTAHYQSPRQMMCLWEKLKAGKPQCCNTH